MRRSCCNDPEKMVACTRIVAEGNNNWKVGQGSAGEGQGDRQDSSQVSGLANWMDDRAIY